MWQHYSNEVCSPVGRAFFLMTALILVVGCGGTANESPATTESTDQPAETAAGNETIADESAAVEMVAKGTPETVAELNAPDRLAVVSEVERQPFVAQTKRLVEAMDFAGSPFSDVDLEAINAAMALEDSAACIEGIQRVLNSYTLVDVHINPEARVKLAQGECEPLLQQQGWRAFLVRVHNEPRVTARLSVTSRNSQPTMDFAKEGTITEEDVAERWMKVEMVDQKPLNPRLSGLRLEYRIVSVYSRDAGEREGHLAFDIGHGTQDIGFRNDLHVLFQCQPAVRVVFNVKDHDGTPSIASLVIQDERGQLYPLPARRVAPDFFFQEQVYRASGESVMLPAGSYEIAYSRGPEYLREVLDLQIPDAETHTVDVQLTRWVDPVAKGWVSGDHHIHASGCSHYQSPAIGVEAPVMLRHIEGEALSIGNVLTWGPGWEYQKNNFCGTADEVSTDHNVIRYDVEVSQFPSDHTGHLCLLGLSEDDYPGTTAKSEWPSWGLPILHWAKSQGATTGVAHSGWGLDVSPENRIPNYVIPPMDGIGAQEFLVHAVHDAVDFISTVDTPYVWELNFWYHMMNCGFDIKASGETDFPCIYGERVGLGRSYVRFNDVEKLGYPEWVQGVQEGRSYVSDGYSHLMDFTVNEVTPGGEADSVLAIEEPQHVHVTANVAAWLDEVPRTVFSGSRNWDTFQKEEMRRNNREEIPIRDLPYTDKPYWHLERARIGDTRDVTVELIVNGISVDQQVITADGTEIPVEFDVEIERSSWIALRILAASHTNPVIVQVGGQPVRASKLSAEWCLNSVDQVWLQKAMNIRSEERGAAREAYEVARKVYQKIVDESYDDTATLSPEDAALRRRQHINIQEDVNVMEFAMASNDGEYGKVMFERKVRGFTGEIELKLSVEPTEATIHYTLDGSPVTADSPVCDGAVKLVETATVSARGFIDGKACTDVASAKFTQFTEEDFGKSLTPGETQQGLNYQYFQGDYQKLDNIMDVDLVSEYVSANFSLDVRERDRYFALKFTGMIEIPQDGIYTFETTSNDGSRLFIGDTLVVDNDGPHGMQPVEGMIPLKAGMHPIRVDYYNSGGSWGLETTWKGPDFDEQPIPDSALHRKPLAAIEQQSTP